MAAQTCSGEDVRRPDTACNRPTRAPSSCNIYDAATLQCGIKLPIVTAATVAEKVAKPAGVKRAEVLTARLVQDERGWLRLAS